MLVAARNPLNIGAAARAMSNFGFLHLRVVNPYEVAFREARSAVNASELLANAEEYETVADAVADCSLVVGTTAAQHRELQVPLERLDAGAPLIRHRLENSRVALLFGSEKRGLANDDISHCHLLMHIPTRDEHVSMNLGQAVAVCLYELARGAEPEPVRTEPELATAGDLERMTRLMLKCMIASGFARPDSPSAEEKLRRLIRRLHVPAGDVAAWFGIYRQLAWKLRLLPPVEGCPQAPDVTRRP